MFGTLERLHIMRKAWLRSRARRFLAAEKDGVAAIEFAIVLPIFIVLTFGLVNYGYAMFAKHSMQRVAGETMRAVAYGELSVSAAQAFAKAEMEATFGSFGAGQLTPSVRMLPSGDEFVVSIRVDADRFDLVKFPPIQVSRYASHINVQNTGKLITRFNPSI